MKRLLQASYLGCFFVNNITLNSKNTYQPISLIISTFASGIKKLLQGFKVLRLNARLAFSSWAHILKI